MIEWHTVIVSVLTSTSVLGPVFLLGALGVLTTSLRWIFADALPVHRLRPSAEDDFGLLRAVAVLHDLDTAQSVRALLVAGEVRATVATGRDGLVRVLVFPDEHARALRLVSWVL